MPRAPAAVASHPATLPLLAAILMTCDFETDMSKKSLADKEDYAKRCDSGLIMCRQLLTGLGVGRLPSAPAKLPHAEWVLRRLCPNPGAGTATRCMS